MNLRFMPYAMIGLACVVLSGCESTMMRYSENVPETIAKTGGVKMNIAASSKINPDARGKANPVRLKVYQLTDRRYFVNADYRELADQDFMVLGDTLVRQTEVTVKPGQTLNLALDQNVTGRYVGVVALFNRPDGENWRVISSVTSNVLQVSIDENKIYMQ